jgi:tetratricopeptide (TPR) repeat protein
LFRLKNGQREAAETDLRAALNQAPKSPRAHLALAHLLRGRDPAQAIEHLDAALRADPTCVEAVELRALLRARMGDPRFESDVDLLATKPTPTHLYNAACALSVYAAKSNDSSKLHRAAQFLVRSFSAGFPLEEALSDPDLTPLRDAPDFHGLFESVRTTGMPVP